MAIEKIRGYHEVFPDCNLISRTRYHAIYFFLENEKMEHLRHPDADYGKDCFLDRRAHQMAMQGEVEHDTPATVHSLCKYRAKRARAA